MSSRRFAPVLRSECRELVRIAPMIAVALVVVIWLGPTLVSFAAVQFQSPVSPPATVPASGRVTEPASFAPELPTSASIEATEVPPPPPPIVAQPVTGTPPTLWIVVGLLVVGLIVVALVFMRRPSA